MRHSDKHKVSVKNVCVRFMRNAMSSLRYWNGVDKLGDRKYSMVCTYISVSLESVKILLGMEFKTTRFGGDIYIT